MNLRTHKSESGSAHLVLVIILVLIILGLLGFVFWQNVLHKKVSSTTPSASTSKSTQPSVTSAISWKTFSDKLYGISFQYPSTWKVKVLNEQPLVNALPNLNVEVTNSDGDKIGQLETTFQGGQTCDNTVHITLQTLDRTPLILAGETEPSVYTAEIYSDSVNNTFLVYGISAVSHAPTTNGTITTTCDDSQTIFARIPIGGVQMSTPYNNVSFQGKTSYQDTASAQAFLSSSDYKLASHMIQSLTTAPIAQPQQ